MNNDNTGRIYEVLDAINGFTQQEYREALHEAWPVYFQITTLNNDDYQRFLRNLKGILNEKRIRNNFATNRGNRGELSEQRSSI